MGSHVRNNRVAEEIKRELAQIIRTELKDPRVKGLISITNVKVTGDMRYAEIFISHFGNKEEHKDVLLAIKKAAGFLRTELGKRIRFRFTPELLFKFDESMEHGARISAILSEIKNNQEDSDGADTEN
ncbi:MAG: 30S ribosome-binding factor RbfA [Peptococcaceae bacterium]